MKCPICNAKEEVEVTNPTFEDKKKGSETIIGKGQEYYCSRCENYFTWDSANGIQTSESIMSLKKQYYNNYNDLNDIEDN